MAKKRARAKTSDPVEGQDQSQPDQNQNQDQEVNVERGPDPQVAVLQENVESLAKNLETVDGNLEAAINQITEMKAFVEKATQQTPGVQFEGLQETVMELASAIGEVRGQIQQLDQSTSLPIELRGCLTPAELYYRVVTGTIGAMIQAGQLHPNEPTARAYLDAGFNLADLAINIAGSRGLLGPGPAVPYEPENEPDTDPIAS